MVEMMVVVAIILTICAIAVPNLIAALRHAKIAKAVGDIHSIGTDIEGFKAMEGRYPDALTDLCVGLQCQTSGYPYLNDPWHNPYQYLNFANVKGKGKMRKDRFLVPINTFYDLYSMGEDGQTVTPLTAKVSQDDIVRANDGDFVGLATDF